MVRRVIVQGLCRAATTKPKPLRLATFAKGICLRGTHTTNDSRTRPRASPICLRRRRPPLRSKFEQIVVEQGMVAARGSGRGVVMRSRNDR